MYIRHDTLPALRLAILVVFTASCAGIFGYLWVNSGGKLPAVTEDGYQVSFDVPQVANLVTYSDVMIAGVPVGKVESVVPHEGGAKVTVKLDDGHPLHDGAKAQIRNKTLVEETFVELTDGEGADIANGAELPPGSARPGVNLDDVLASIDGETRASLGRSLRSLGKGTQGTRQQNSDALTGLGLVGRQGADVAGALADQSKDLQELSANSAALLAALDTRRGQIAELVESANTVTEATAGSAGEIEAVVRALPPLLDTAREASGGLNKVSASLSPVAANLAESAPALSAALEELPATSADLRALLPSLDGVLTKAPATLSMVPRLADDVRAIIPGAAVALSDVNPMLAYLKPYGPEVAAYFTNWNDSLNAGDSVAKFWRVYPILNEKSLAGSPVNTNKFSPFDKFSPYPLPGSLQKPGPFERPYPRVQREGP
jgi:phospholipid/cholesterol/gamma-HCH transport system substrate-binding protein